MALSQDLINQFVKLTDRKEKPKEVTVNGTYKMINGEEYVQIDGSEIWTPVTSTVEAETGERVKVMIKNHTATVTGNISSPSARSKSVKDLKDEVDEQGNTIKQLDNTIEQQNNSIIQIDNNIKQVNNDILQANNAINQQGNIIKQLGNEINQQGDVINSMNNDITANSNEITAINNTIVQQNNTITQHGNTIEQQGNIIKQQGNEITQQGNKIEQFNNEIEQQGNSITQLNNKILQQDNVIQQQGNIIDQQDNIITEHGNNITILNSGFSIIDGVLVGLSQAIIDELKTKHLDTEYATIDFANINMAAVTKLFTESGIIKDLVVQEGKITGELVGVTIKGDLIEGNTIAAEKLVVKGSDGLYYKLNIDGLNNVSVDQASKFILLDSKPEDWETNYKDYYLISGNNYVHITDNNIPTWQANTYYKLSSTYETGLDGTNIVAKSITADKVSVTDLVAFGATIGGYNITQHSIYSGGKSSVNNISPGLYMDDSGQIAFGDNKNFIKFFKDTDNQFKLRISANEIYTSTSSKSIAEQIEELAQDTTEAYNKAQAAQSSATDITNRVNDKENNYNFKYHLDVTVYGDSNKFYPVIIKYGNQNIKRTIMVTRDYGELAPSDWNTSTHKGSLTLKILCNFGGWGGVNYSWEIHELEEMYSEIFGGACNCGNNCMFAIFLRGGGETGARYHLYSDQKLDSTKSMYDYGWDNDLQKYVKNKLPSPQISYRTNYVQYKSDLCFGSPGNKIPDSNGRYDDLQYKVDAPAPRNMQQSGTKYVRTAAINEEIRIRKFIKLSQDNDSILKDSIKSVVNLYYASDSSTPPTKPTAHITANSSSSYKVWNIALPTYNEQYPYLFTCKETLTNGGTYSWTSVNQTTYSNAIKEIQGGLNSIQSDYLKESTFSEFKTDQIEKDNGIIQRLKQTSVTIYGNDDGTVDPESASALVNHINKVDNDINADGGINDRLGAAEDTIDGTGLNDYDQRVKITQRFLDIETDVESIKNTFNITGGTNLVQNSVGYFASNDNKPTMWDITSNTIYTPFGYDGDLTGVTVSRGKLFCAKGSIKTTTNNIIALLSNKMISISFKYKNGANATSKIKIFNGSTVYFEKTFNTAVNQWTEYRFNPDTDPELANPTFLNTSNSLQILIESANSTNNNGFEISDLMLNYGNVKPWELFSNEVYGAMVKLSSLGIEVTATTANTKNFMTTDGILVYRYDSKTDTIIGTEPITKITDNGTVTNKLESTGDIIERNLINTMIKDSSNHDVYVEYIR